jgi:hypothetical protein
MGQLSFGNSHAACFQWAKQKNGAGDSSGGRMEILERSSASRLGAL